MNITSSQLIKILPSLTNVDDWTNSLNNTFDKFFINNRYRICMFLAQVIYESNNFTELEENLNYSANGLLITFPNYFSTEEQAKLYAHQPQKIANYVYANRMGNGNTDSNDGWTYRGRGLIQITGKENYNNFAEYMEMVLTDTFNYMINSQGACHSAGWFWKIHNLNSYADTDQFTNCTKVINGGINGLTDRKKIWSKVRSIL